MKTKLFICPFVQGEGDSIQKDMEIRRRIMSRKVQPIRYQRIGTPPPIKGRRHENIQTDKYLEEVSTPNTH